MLISFSGVHGSGKTTLATKLSEIYGVPFIQSRAGQIHEAFGVNASDDIPFVQRLQIQIAIFNDWMTGFQEAQANGYGIFDRTPLDFLAYLLADCPRKIDDGTNLMVNSFTNTCIDVSRAIPDLFVVTPHGAPEEDRGTGKANSQNVAYSLKYQAILLSLANMRGGNYTVLESGTVDQRLQHISMTLQEGFEIDADYAGGENDWQNGSNSN